MMTSEVFLPRVEAPLWYSTIPLAPTFATSTSERFEDSKKRKSSSLALYPFVPQIQGKVRSLAHKVVANGSYACLYHVSMLYFCIV